MIKLKYIPLALFSLTLLVSCQAKRLTTNLNKIDSTKINITFQQKKIFKFNNGQVSISNDFAGARINSVIQQNDSTFNLVIAPENTPINPSPWYAFKIWSVNKKRVYINLDYKEAVHRYNPKLLTGSKIWEDVINVKVSNDKKAAFFDIQVSNDTTLVAAQELISSGDNYKWEDKLTKLPFVKKQKIGLSILGKPINVLTIGKESKKLIVILSRQHPPEVTGYMAMQEFVETIISDTKLAKDFRTNYQVLLIPFINPDGVDEGNWRHNASGVDLNRDWETFLQPETRSVRNYLLNKVVQQNAKVYFGIDFHSTYYDVFYTNQDQPLKPTNIPGFTTSWLDVFSHQLPKSHLNIKPSPNGGNVSKSWMGRALGAEALTYEVGDDTPRMLLKLKGKVAAENMMQLLLELSP